MADTAAKLSKPQLRGLLNSVIKKNIITAVGLSILSGIAVHYLVAEPRKKKYAEFYKNYDPEEDYRNKVKAGADFQAENV